MDASQWTLLTYTGISAVVVVLIGGIKKLWPAWTANKEPHMGVALALILGVAAKLTIAGAFSGVQWVPHIVGLVIAAFGAKIGHDWIVNTLVKGKE